MDLNVLSPPIERRSVHPVTVLGKGAGRELRPWGSGLRVACAQEVRDRTRRQRIACELARRGYLTTYRIYCCA